MTIIEIIVATMILFVGVTAILGLMAASTSMGVTAKQGNIAINAVNSYIESVRGLSFDEVGLVGGEPEGSLESTHVVQVQGVRVTITPSVEWVNDPNMSGGFNYKRLTVAAVASLSGGREYSYSTETFIRHGDDYRPADAALPIVAFLAPSPEDVVSGDNVRIEWSAQTTMETGRITNVKVLSPQDALFGPLSQAEGVDVGGRKGAEWTPNEPSASGTFYWDTTLKKLDADGNVTDDPLYPDGQMKIWVEVWDNLVQSSRRERTVYIDNSAPDLVASVTGTPVTATLANVAWPPAKDGPESDAHSYRIRFRQSGFNQEDYSTWQELPGGTPGYTPTATNSYNQITQPFSRYLASVQSVSIGGRSSDWTSWTDLAVAQPYVSRPRLTGTYTNTFSGSGSNERVTTNVSVSLTPPSFTVGPISLRTELYRSSSPTMEPKTLVSSGQSYTYSNQPNVDILVHKVHGIPSLPAWYYQMRVEFRPYGYPNGGWNNAIEETWSNVIGPSGSAATGPMPEVW